MECEIWNYPREDSESFENRSGAFKFRFGYLVQSRVLPWKISVKNSYQNRSYTSIPYNKFYTSALNTYTIVKSVDTVCIWCRCRRCCHFCVVATHYRCVFLISIFFPMYTQHFSFKKYQLSVRFSVRSVFFILVANNNKNSHLWVNVYIIKWTCAHGISTIDDTTSENGKFIGHLWQWENEKAWTPNTQR